MKRLILEVDICNKMDSGPPSWFFRPDQTNEITKIFGKHTKERLTDELKNVHTLNEIFAESFKKNDALGELGCTNLVQHQKKLYLTLYLYQNEI